MSIAAEKRRFTADEYQRMGEAGIFCPDDRVELIDGEVVVMSPIGPRHNACVSSANQALVRAAGDAAIVLPQGSVRLDFHSEPQPDLVLLKPRADFYASRHAGPADILLVVEIAASSIEYDREVKARVYAKAGVPEVLARRPQRQRCVGLFAAERRSVSEPGTTSAWRIDCSGLAHFLRHQRERAPARIGLAPGGAAAFVHFFSIVS